MIYREQTEKQLLKELLDLDEKIEELGQKRSEIKQELISRKSQFKIGDIIEWEFGCKAGGKFRRGVVRKILEWVGSEPMWRCGLMRKDLSIETEVDVRLYNNPRLAKKPLT